MTKVRGVETTVEEEKEEEKKKEKNISRTADIQTVERQNNSIIHDVINEVEEKSLSNIKSKIGDIKETISNLNSTDQIEKVFKGKIRELNATIQSFREEAAPKSEAVVGLPVVKNWPESERVEVGGEEESEEEILNQAADLRDDPEIVGDPPTIKLMETDHTETIAVNLSEQPPDLETFRGNLKRAGSDQNSLVSGDTSDFNGSIAANTPSQSPPQAEISEGSYSQKISEDPNALSLTGGKNENSLTSADLETTTKSVFEDAPLWIPESTTFATKTTFPKSPIKSKTESSILASTSSTSDTRLITKIKPNPVFFTSTIQTSSVASTPPTSVSSVKSILSTTWSDPPTSSTYNISVSTATILSSTTFSYKWVQGICEEGQVECREGGSCVRKVKPNLDLERENESNIDRES